jgi:hypothetical protein
VVSRGFRPIGMTGEQDHEVHLSTPQLSDLV